MKTKLRQILKSAWAVISRNIVLKILSFVFAIMLWSYVISSNSSITRVKVLNGLTGYVSGQATLEVYGLALLTDPTEALSDISVQVQVPQASYNSATGENVQVTLDVSSVRTAGVKEVPIKATTNYGKVVSIYPSSLTMTFETLDSRSIPVNVQTTGTRENDYWYNVSRANPQQVTISGATSIIQSISSAVVYADLTGRDSSFTTANPYVLLDNAGNEISTTMLNRSATSISVGMDVYPTRELSISTATDDVLTGQVADGYIIEAITVQPESVTVAADKDLLGALDKLVIEPLEIDHPSQSFTRRATISGLTDFKYISSEQVYVTVQIAEETIGEWLDNVYITFVGKSDDLTLSWQRNSIAVYVTGPRSKVEALVKDGLTATVDLSGYTQGSYEAPISINGDNYPSLVFELEANTVQVTLDKVSPAE